MSDNYNQPSWDDRKILLDLWQERAPLPDVPLREGGIFDALLAVAVWGYSKAKEEENDDRNKRITELEALLASNHRAYLAAIGADHECP